MESGEASPAAEAVRPGLLLRLREAAAGSAPLLRREFLGLLRSPRAFWLAAVTVAAAGILPLAAWPPEGSPLPSGAARAAVRYHAAAVTLAILLFVPALAAGSIAGERERGTYESLVATAISPAAIVLGKILASALYFLLLLALTFPTVCILYLLGGTTWWWFLGVLCAHQGATLLLALVGVWASSRNHRTGTAVLQAFGMLGALWLLGAVSTILAPISLFLAFRLIASFAVQNAAIAEPGLPPEHEAMPFPWLEPPPPPERTLLVRAVLRPCREGIPDGWSPVLATALRSEAAGSAPVRRLLFWGCAAVLFIFFVGGTKGYMEARAALEHAPIAVLGIIGATLPGLAAFSLVSERDAGRIDLIRTTLLGPREILAGKLLAALSTAIPVALLGVAGFCAIFPLTFLPEGPALLGLGVSLALSVAGALAASAAGLLAGVLARRAATAFVIAYAVVLFLAVPVGLAAVEPFARPGASFAVAAAWTIAAAAALALAGLAMERRWLRD